MRVAVPMPFDLVPVTKTETVSVASTDASRLGQSNIQMQPVTDS